jgi:hypothetical protein
MVTCRGPLHGQLGRIDRQKAGQSTSILTESSPPRFAKPANFVETKRFSDYFG